MATQTFKLSRTYPDHQYQNWISQTAELIQTIPLINNIYYWGAKGNGISDDTAAIQRALDAENTLYFPPGIYKITSPLSMTGRSNIYLQGNNAILDGSTIPALAFQPILGIYGESTSTSNTTTVTANIAAGATTITVASATNIAIGDTLYIFSGTNETNVNGELWYTDNTARNNRINFAEVVKIAGNVITVDSQLFFAMDATTYVVTAQIIKPAKNIRIEGLTFLGASTVNATLANGFGLNGLELYRCYNVDVNSCIFKWCQGHSMNVAYTWHMRVSNCFGYGYPDGYIYSDFVEGLGTGYYFAFFQRCIHIQMENCQTFKTRHTMDGSYTGEIIVVGNNATDNHRSAYRAHAGMYHYSIIGNKATGLVEAVLNSGWTLSECCDNHFITGGNAGIVDGDPAGVYNATSQGSLAGVCNISNNIVETRIAQADGIRLNNYYDRVNIEGNHITGTNDGILCQTILINACNITNNHIICNGAGFSNAIYFPTPSAFDVAKNNIKIHTNNISGYTGQAIRFFGAGTRATRVRNLSIVGNICDARTSPAVVSVSLGVGYFGTGIYLADNSFIGNTVEAISIGTTTLFERYPTVIYGTPIDTALSAGGPNFLLRNATGVMPTGATVQKGAIIQNSDPDATEAIGWVATNAGTAGTLVGVTATTDGTTTIILVGNTDAKVYIGSWITVNATNVNVLTVSADFATITVSATVAAAGPGAAVAYFNPVFVQYGRISNTVTGYSGVLSNVANVRATSFDMDTITLPQLADLVGDLVADLKTAGIISV
jgi:hypothetical protein